jgi:hypothetical protein
MLDSPVPDKAEKNWAPLVWRDRLVGLYNLHPLIVVDLEGGSRFTKLNIDSHKYSPEWQELLGSLRGSTPLVDVKDGKLGIFHKYATVNQKRNYYHFWVKLDDDLRVTHVSEPFTFENAQIEFCMGLSIGNDGKSATAYYTLMDRMPSARKYSIESIVFHRIK